MITTGCGPISNVNNMTCGTRFSSESSCENNIKQADKIQSALSSSLFGSKTDQTLNQKNSKKRKIVKQPEFDQKSNKVIKIAPNQEPLQMETEEVPLPLLPSPLIPGSQSQQSSQNSLSGNLTEITKDGLIRDLTQQCMIYQGQIRELVQQNSFYIQNQEFLASQLEVQKMLNSINNSNLI